MFPVIASNPQGCTLSYIPFKFIKMHNFCRYILSFAIQQILHSISVWLWLSSTNGNISFEQCPLSGKRQAANNEKEMQEMVHNPFTSK